MQPPPPGFPPPWGGSPNDPAEHTEAGFGGYEQPPASHDPQPLPGYAAPTAGYPQAGYGQQPGYGSPPLGSQPISPTVQQVISWITFAVVGLLGLLGAILTLALWINMTSAVNRASDMCNKYGGEYSALCRQQLQHVVPTIPVALVVCLFLIMAAGLTAAGGAVMLFLRKQPGQFLLLGGGIVMLVLAIGCEARYGATGRITYDLVAGFVIAAVGGLLLIPAFRMTMGMRPKPIGGPMPSGFQGGGQWPYGPPQPPQQAPPGAGGGYPPPHW